MNVSAACDLAALLGGACWRRLTGRAWRPPRVRETLAIPALHGDVRIRRDDCGVPCIEAESLADLGCGLGVVMAQDRLWQMEAMRRLAGGRLAEIVGDRPLRSRRMHTPGTSLLEVDRLYRSFRMYPVARREFSLLGADGQALLCGFARGVNAWLADCPARALPPECQLLGFRPEPWGPEDSLAIGKLFGWFLSLAFPAKPLLARLLAVPDVHWLLPPAEPGRPAILQTDGLPRTGELDLLAREALGLTGPGLGSNAWALHGTRTASGKPILCSDPHLLFELPALWYPLVARTPAFQVAGGTLPGVPLPLVGRTAHLAWGCTAVMADDGDYYREEPDAAGERVRRGGDWQPVERTTESFRVRGSGREVTHDLRFVRHEGVRCPLLDGPPGEPPVSYRWVGFEPWPSLEGFLGAARATNVSEFEIAMRALAAPALNFVVADTAGSIAYLCAGRFPRRPSARRGRVVLDGRDPADAWQGYLDWQEHPRCVDPAAGFLVTANNRIAPDLPATLANSFWEPPYRAARVTGLLAACREATAEAMQAVQADVLSLQAVGLMAALIRPAAGDLAHPDARRAAALLLDWDSRMAEGSAAAALYQLAYQALLRRAIRPALEAVEPGLFARYLSTLHLAVPAVDRALARCDPRAFPGGAAALLDDCLAAAWREATATLGEDPRDWRWGRLHRLTFRHALGRGQGKAARLLAWLLRLNRGPFPRPGDGMTVNLAAHALSEPFAVLAGPSYRQIVDLGRPEDDRWIVAGGVSGDPRSAHYDDQLETWRRDGTRPMRLDPPGAIALRLVPGPDCARGSPVL